MNKKILVLFSFLIIAFFISGCSESYISSKVKNNYLQDDVVTLDSDVRGDLVRIETAMQDFENGINELDENYGGEYNEENEYIIRNCNAYIYDDGTIARIERSLECEDEPGVVIRAEGVELICDEGVTIKGNENSIGIFVSRDNNIVRNCNIKNFEYGIYLGSVSNNIISGNSVERNRNGGIVLASSDNNRISENSLNRNDRDGLGLFNSDYNIIINNVMNENKNHGIYLIESSSNELSGNLVSENYNDGILLSDSTKNNLFINSINNNGRGENIADGIYLFRSSSNEISDNIILDNRDGGIYLYYYSNYNILFRNIIINNNIGIILSTESNNNELSSNEVGSSEEDGFYSFKSYNTIIDSIFCDSEVNDVVIIPHEEEEDTFLNNQCDVVNPRNIVDCIPCPNSGDDQIYGRGINPEDINNAMNP